MSFTASGFFFLPNFCFQNSFSMYTSGPYTVKGGMYCPTTLFTRQQQLINLTLINNTCPPVNVSRFNSLKIAFVFL